MSWSLKATHSLLVFLIDLETVISFKERWKTNKIGSKWKQGKKQKNKNNFHLCIGTTWKHKQKSLRPTFCELPDFVTIRWNSASQESKSRLLTVERPARWLSDSMLSGVWSRHAKKVKTRETPAPGPDDLFSFWQLKGAEWLNSKRIPEGYKKEATVCFHNADGPQMR